jgi:hypothetical protein
MEPLYKLHEVATRLREKYDAIVRETDRGMQCEFPGVLQTFELSSANDELTLFAEAWHEHFDSMEDLEGFLHRLFDGTLQITVTYKGTTPVAHRVVARRGDETRVLSRSGVLMPLFWRRKSQRTFTYEKSPNQAMERTADPRALDS